MPALVAYDSSESDTEDLSHASPLRPQSAKHVAPNNLSGVESIDSNSTPSKASTANTHTHQTPSSASNLLPTASLQAPCLPAYAWSASSVPTSPPSSPDPSITAKFAHFLALKHQLTHLNVQLSASRTIRNPAVVSKLREFSGVDEWAQYSTATHANLVTGNGVEGEEEDRPDDGTGIVTSWPPWAYGEELNKAQARGREKREAKEKRKRAAGSGKLEFVRGGR